MRGAVLHKMGINSVKERLMRRSYGVIANKAFRQGIHPEFRKFTDIAGVVRCRGNMNWYATKVHLIIPHSFRAKE
jgi:hypothetical protein